MKEFDRRRQPMLNEEKYRKHLEPGDIPMYNLGEDAGSIGEWW